MASREFDVIIEPGRRKTFYWKDLWRFKGLFYYLAWRDILVRYKQTAIGVLWSVLRPLLTIVVFTLVFNKLGNFPSETGVPYAIMVCVGMLPWQFFSSAFSESANSLVANSNLLTKVYFPRLIVPASTVIVCLIDFLISFVILIGLYVFYSYVPDWRILLFPFFLLLATITAMGFGLFIAALNVKYRDFRYVIPFIVQFGLYISPVGFSSNVVYANEHIPQILKYLYALNPMVGVIDGFRWSMLGGSVSLHLPEFLSSIAVSVLFLFVGIWYFRKMERTFADVI
ncbi:MAG: ABC transporter permease [Bacteroidetes bacterium]|nr:ABC transporter permease [Bacteroidota bacterium]MBK9525491.1 ABC transporter permease [Bacteroidota bacterium]MBK9542242.1 ABC transporter permease [Bacteroidota bacterium]MBP6402840.1 ABC transporter permease [Bacteroidia bacterium]MBP6648710.1 ABC transporter permease [Bacteroidia bacterium]